MTTTTNNTDKTKQAFKNLFKALVKKHKKQHAELITALNLITDKSEIFGSWYYYNALPKAKQNADAWKNLDELKAYITKASFEGMNKQILKHSKHLNDIATAPDLLSGSISVEWKPSRTWGANPRAQYKQCAINTETKCHGWEVFNTNSIGGCGYDKGSTAIAEALNQSKSVLKALYTHKNKPRNIDKPNREVFDYGAGNGILPRIEGGVGASCYPDVFKAIGYKFSHITGGKMFDVYTIEKLKK